MILRSPAVVCAVRQQGETGSLVRLFTPDEGLIAAYVSGGRGRQLRPVLIAGNEVEAEFTARPGNQMIFARVELLISRAPWLAEPLAAAGISWVTTLTAAALPERQAHPALYPALCAVLGALCHAPSARGWLPGLAGYEALLLRELGYPAPVGVPEDNAALAAFDALAGPLARYALADHRADVMAARTMLRDRLARIK